MVTHGNQDTRPRHSPQGSKGPIPEANKILLFVRQHHQNREPSTSSCGLQHHFAEVLAQQQCPKRPDDILPAHNDNHLGRWRRVLPGIPFGSIFRNFTVHRDRDKPVAGTILKLDDLVA